MDLYFVAVIFDMSIKNNIVVLISHIHFNSNYYDLSSELRLYFRQRLEEREEKIYKW